MQNNRNEIGRIVDNIDPIISVAVILLIVNVGNENFLLGTP